MITQCLFLYLFVDVYDILVLRFIPAILRERGWNHGLHPYTFSICRSKCRIALHLQMAWQVTKRTAKPKKESPRGGRNSLGAFPLGWNQWTTYYTFCFYYMLFPAKVKRCAESLQALFSWHLLYLFADVYGILVLRFIPPILLGKGGETNDPYSHNLGVCRGKYNFTLYLQVAWQTRQGP